MSEEQGDTFKADESEEHRSSPDQLRRGLEAEFNAQRAKMKELFLQKEENLRKVVQEKEQLEDEVVGLRAQLQQLETLCENQSTEIQNLQMLVRETVDESSSCSEELRHLRARNSELEQHLTQLRQQQEPAMAPAAQLVRSLARKLGADSDQDVPHRKAEELEVGQDPRELELAALKNKLRETDAQLQDALKSLSNPVTKDLEDGKAESEWGRPRCDMCANYEKQLVAEQRQTEAAKERATMLDQALKLATEELESVRSVHEETVRAWRAERAAGAHELDALRAALARAEATLEEAQRGADAAQRHTLLQVTELTVHREELQRKLDSLEKDNKMLLGQYNKLALEMQNEAIDLPDTVDELQEYALQLREALVSSSVGREAARGGERAVRAQLQAASEELHRRDLLLHDLHSQLIAAREELDQLQTEKEHMKELGDKLRQSSDMNEKLLEDKKRLQSDMSELRSRVSALQQELDNSEKVQQDFVRLSQSLQIQLQRIREADTEVRWQHDEDVHECPTCHVQLLPKKKVHCRHCGRIFCSACLPHAVPSGPRGAPARVCAVCRTLLQSHTAPYFSTAPPRSPD